MTAKNRNEKLQGALKLRHTLRGHTDVIHQIAWSPDGRYLASTSSDKTLRLWDQQSGKLRRTLKGHSSKVVSVAWSPDSKTLASWSRGETIRIWAAEAGRFRRAIKSSGSYFFRSSPPIDPLAWSPDGHTLTSVASLHLWDTGTWRQKQPLWTYDDYRGQPLAWTPEGQIILRYEKELVYFPFDTSTRDLSRAIRLRDCSVNGLCIAWSPDLFTLVLGSWDGSIAVWDIAGARKKAVLQGHTAPVLSCSFSFDNRVLASKSADGTTLLWDSNTWEMKGSWADSSSRPKLTHLTFHPALPILASLTEGDKSINIWELDFAALFAEAPTRKTVRYSNAKVVLMGESSTGKTCLARALMGEPFEPQESTHGMKVWNFQTETAKRPDGAETMREILLWDLAGQTEYQVVHQLFLDETALGLVVFDPTHPENPFGGVGHWEKALRRAVRDDSPRLLVAGRVDRGHPTATNKTIETFKREHGFSAFIRTSSKTGEGIERLKALINKSIQWERLPVTSSPELWLDIREYLLKRRLADDLLTRRSELREAFRLEHSEADFADGEFDTVITHAQTQGLVWQLSFGDFILLKPEILNDYASAVVRSARQHPEGLGCVVERNVVEANIQFEDLRRLPNSAAERTLLHAVVELFLAREVALREGTLLVFPSKFNRQRPEYPQPPVREVAYRFAGALEDVYATLVVRLFYSGAFDLKDLWKNAAEFWSSTGQLCGFVLSSRDEGNGELSVFFEKTTSMEAKVLFLRFIHEHLQARALLGSVKRQRIYRCPACRWEVTETTVVQKRLERGDSFVRCLDCDAKIRLRDLMEEKFGDPELLQQVREMDDEVEEKKGQEVGITTAKAKQDVGEFDVFLAHNNSDERHVRVVSDELKQRGLSTWLDKEQIPPGRWFQDVLQQVIPKVKSAAIFIGPKGLGRWEIIELRSFISQCVEREIPVIPVLLPGVKRIPNDLLFLKELNWVRFANTIDDIEALDRLEWGVTGKQPPRSAR